MFHILIVDLNEILKIDIQIPLLLLQEITLPLLRFRFCFETSLVFLVAHTLPVLIVKPAAPHFPVPCRRHKRPSFLHDYGQTVEFFFKIFCQNLTADCPITLCFQFFIQPPDNLVGIAHSYTKHFCRFLCCYIHFFRFLHSLSSCFYFRDFCSLFAFSLYRLFCTSSTHFPC